MQNSIIAALAIFELAAPCTAAQSLILHSSDYVIVDSTGTHGILSGRHVDNKITFYTSTGSTHGVDNDAVQLNGNAAFTLGSSGTIVGGPNGSALEALESSRVTITGGEVSCQQPKMSPGFGNAVVADGSSKVTIMGGKIIGGKNGDVLDAELQGVILVNGGTITGQYGPALAAEGNEVIFLAGGMVTMKHAEVGIMAGGASGTINLLSRNKPFSVNGVAMNHTELAPNSSGILADGQRLNMGFLNGGHIFLNVNKPATLRSISIPATETR